MRLCLNWYTDTAHGHCVHAKGADATNVAGAQFRRAPANNKGASGSVSTAAATGHTEIVVRGSQANCVLSRGATRGYCTCAVMLPCV